MKKVIRVKYRNIFKYNDHQEIIKYDENGYLEEFVDEKIISFEKENLIKIELKANEVTLHNGNSVLKLALGSDILNEYQTEYGLVPLITRLINYNVGNNTIKVIYELYDGDSLISHVYMMLSYLILET